MRNSSVKIVSGVLLLIFLFAAPSTAEITSFKIRSDDRSRILFNKFGLTETGHVSVAISSVSFTSVPVTSSLSRPDPSRMGFFFVLEEARDAFELEGKFCDLDSNFISPLFTFSYLSNQSSFNISHAVTYPSAYSFYFANCNSFSYVTMDVQTEFYNTENGTTKNYLSAGLTQLPSIYFYFSLFYLCLLGFWIAVCFMNKASIHKNHLLMGLLLVMKAFNMFCAWKDLYHLKVTGTPPRSWDVMFYISQLLNSVFLYIVVKMIGDGYHFLKPLLQESVRKKVLMFVIALQVLATVASVLIAKTGPFFTEWVTWNIGLFLVEGILIQISTIGLPIYLCGETFENDDHDAKAARKYVAKFGIVVGGNWMIGVTLLVFGNLASIVNYKYEWVFIASLEISSFVLYMVMYSLFMPFDKKYDEHFDQERPVDVQVE